MIGRREPEPVENEYRDKLIAARMNLEKESSALQKDVAKVGGRVDPIGTIIRNIRQVRGGS